MLEIASTSSSTEEVNPIGQEEGTRKGQRPKGTAKAAPRAGVARTVAVPVWAGERVIRSKRPPSAKAL